MLSDPEVEEFLKGLDLENNNEVKEAFKTNHMKLNILKTINHDILKSMNITSYGIRHKLVKAVKELDG